MYVTDDAFKPVVKEERPDEAEIRELAAKMVEAHKAKANANHASAISSLLPNNRPAGMAPSNQGQMSNLLYYNNTRIPQPTSNMTVASKTLPEGKVPLDDESNRGRFGWTSFGENTHIPYIFRAGEKYCAVRILEQKLLNKYLSYLNSDIYSCTCIRSYYITEIESKLLNEINLKHCEALYGRESFTCKDLVVRLVDTVEFYTFLDVCYTKLQSAQNSIPPPKHQPDKCGFIRINKESVVPYTIKGGLKYVPLFYFEGETENLKLKAEKLEGWDLSYLKFCCKVQGIRNELFASETCSVISLNDIKSYFPPGTGFEDYWPSKVMDSQLLVNFNKSNAGGGGGGWTKQPATPPIMPKPSTQNNISKNVINSRGVPMPNIIPRNSMPPTSAPTIQRLSNRPIVATHPAQSSASAVSAARNNQVSQAVMNQVQAVNGWNRLTSAQQTFPPPLVSQTSPIIRMNPAAMDLHTIARSRANAGSSPQYPGYSNTSLQSPVPPPLIRATAHSNQSNLGISTTYTTSSLNVPSPVSANSYPMLSNLCADQGLNMPPPPVPMSTSSHSTSHTKYSASPLIVNGSSNNSNNRDSRAKKPLIPIAETSVENSQVQPYQVQKALVEDKLVPCINFKPYVYSELLMTLPDFVAHYFPACDVESCRKVLTDVLMVELYQGNRLQMEMLMKNGKCSSLTEELPLIQVRSIMNYMPQLKYMLNSHNMSMTGSAASPQPAHSMSDEHAAKKRQRTS